MKIRLVFFATPDIALKSLEALINSDEFEVCAIVTQPPKPFGRGKKLSMSNVKRLAMEHNIDVLEPKRIAYEPGIIEKLKSYDVDFFVTFAFGQILSQEILDIPKFETINLHASLLPKYRGANPICECLLRGDCVTGVTTMVTVLELDAGDICLTEEISLDSDTDFSVLSGKIAEISPELIIKTLKGLYNNTLKRTPQEVSCVSFTKKMQKSDKIISFKNTPNALHNKVRAMCGVNTCHISFKGRIVKILKTDIENSLHFSKIGNASSGHVFKPGEVLEVSKSGIVVACLSGAILIELVKPEGKSKMSAYDWSLGSKIKKGDILGCGQGE